VDTAPKASGCFLGGTQEILGAVSGDLLGGAGKAEDAKLPDAGIVTSRAQWRGPERKQCAETKETSVVRLAGSHNGELKVNRTKQRRQGKRQER
jgi:hypothetical protein